MPLKAVLAAKADVDALPEALRGFYKESGGRYILDADGMVLDEDHESLNTKLAEFRDNNIQLKKDLDRFKDVDPDELRTLKAQIEKLTKQGGRTDDIEAQIAKAIEKATEPLTKSVAQMQSERDQAKQALETKELQDALWQVGVKAGVREEAREFWLSEASKTFKREGDALVGFKGEAPLFSKRKGKAHEPLTAEEWALEVAPQNPTLALLYKDSKGGGAQRTDAGAGGARLVSRDNPDAISSNLDAIAKGTLVVQ
jgi:hypothetical protein